MLAGALLRKGFRLCCWAPNTASSPVLARRCMPRSSNSPRPTLPPVQLNATRAGMWPPEYPAGVPRKASLLSKRSYFQHQKHVQATEVGRESNLWG